MSRGLSVFLRTANAAGRILLIGMVTMLVTVSVRIQFVPSSWHLMLLLGGLIIATFGASLRVLSQVPSS